MYFFHFGVNNYVVSITVCSCNADYKEHTSLFLALKPVSWQNSIMYLLVESRYVPPASVS